MLPYIKVFPNLIDPVELMDDAMAGRLFKAILAYANDREKDLPGPEKFVYLMLKSQFDRDRAEYENIRAVNAINGAKGGRPKKAPGFSQKRPVSEKTEKSQEKEEEEEEDKEKEKDTTPIKPPEPVVVDLEAFAREKPDELLLYSQQCLAGMNRDNVDEMLSFRDVFSDEMIRKAINTTNGNNSRSWSYCRSILRRWQQAGYRTPAEVDAADDRRRASAQAVKTGAKPMLTRETSSEIDADYYAQIMSRSKST